MKRFERSNGLDTALYKNYFLFYTLVSASDIICSVRSTDAISVQPGMLSGSSRGLVVRVLDSGI